MIRKFLFAFLVNQYISNKPRWVRFCIRFHPMDQGVSGRAFAVTKKSAFTHFEAISWTPHP